MFSTIQITLLGLSLLLSVRAYAGGPLLDKTEGDFFSLQYVLQKVSVNHPEIRSARQRAKARSHDVVPAYTPPLTKIGQEYWGVPLGGGLGDAGMKMTMFQQTIPSPGVLLSQGAIARHLVFASDLEVREAEERVLAEAAEVYFKLWALVQEAKIHRAHTDMWEGFLAVLEGGLSSGSSSATDLLRAKAVRARFNYMFENTKQLIQSHEVHLQLLMGTDESLPLEGLETPRVWRESYDARDLEAEALQNNPALNSMSHHVIHSKLVVREKTWSFFPDVSLTYSRMEDSLVGPSARFGFMATVPLMFWKPLRERSAASWRAKATASMYESMEIKLRQNLFQAVAQMANYWRVVQASLDEIIPAAEEAGVIAERQYRSGTGSFLALLDTDRSFLSEELELIQAHAAFGQARARVESLLGRLGSHTGSHSHDSTKQGSE